MSRRRPRSVVAALVLGAALVLAGCDLTPRPEETAEPTTAGEALGSQPPDPHAAILTDALEDLRTSVAAAREALAAAATTAGRPGGDAAELAVALLAAEEQLAQGADDPDPRPLFPGPESSRLETIDYGDAFTETLSAAREAGPAGAPVLDLLRDPVAGDVGGWQRDAGGILDEIASVARSSGDVPDAEAAIAGIDGEGTKALAWALLAADAGDDEERSAYAERGVAHLDIVLAAIDDALADRQVEVGA